MNDWLLALVVLATLVTAALFFLRAPLLPNILASPDQTWLLGVIPSIRRRRAHFHVAKTEFITSALHTYHERVSSGAPVVGSAEMVQWSVSLVPPFLELLSPRNIKFILTDAFPFFGKGELTREIFREVTAAGIFSQDGEPWRQQRRAASHLFTFNRLSSWMFETFLTEGDRVLQELHAAAKSGEEIDLQGLFHDFTFDGMMQIVYGKKTNTIGAKGGSAFSAAFDRTQQTWTRRAFEPSLLWKMKRLFSIGDEGRFKQAVAWLNTNINAIVNERRSHLDEFAEAGDFLSLLLLEAKKTNEPLADKEIRDLSLSILLAGRDTTASALTHLFWLLSKHPEVEQECVAELRSNLTPDVRLTREAVRSLIKLEAAFMETVRVCPPAAMDFRIASKTMQFPSGEIVPGGTFVAFSPRLVHHLPEFYSHTSTLKHWAADCTEFKPQRWIVEETEDGVSSKKILNPPTHEFISFATGPRTCLGKGMAILEGKTLAAMILETFHIDVRPGYEPKEKVAPVAAMLHGLPCTVRLRTK